MQAHVKARIFSFNIFYRTRPFHSAPLRIRNFICIPFCYSAFLNKYFSANAYKYICIFLNIIGNLFRFRPISSSSLSFWILMVFQLMDGPTVYTKSAPNGCWFFYEGRIDIPRRGESANRKF